MLISIAASSCRSFPGAIRVASVAGKDDINSKNTTCLPALRPRAPRGLSEPSPGVRSDVEADGTHQIEGITAGHDPRPHPVIEDQPSLFQPVFKMNVGCGWGQLIGNARER